MKARLSQPYPFYYDSLKRTFTLALVIFIATSFFIYIFQPFTFYFEEHQFSFPVISLLFGLNVSLLFLLLTSLFNISVSRFSLDRYWTVGKELVFWLIFFLIVGIGNFFLRELIYDNPDNFSFSFFATEIFHAYLIGLLFIVLITMINCIRLLKSTSLKADTWNELVHRFREKHLDDPVITLHSESPQDTITFRLSKFMFAMVDGNYVELHLRERDGTISRQIIRNTLSNIESQTDMYREILRVHRSYIVNVKKVNAISGNAQGYKLVLSGISNQVPVSRSYISDFEKVMNLHSIR